MVMLLQAFSDILASNEVFDADMHDVYQRLGMDATATTTLDSYLQARPVCSWPRGGAAWQTPSQVTADRRQCGLQSACLHGSW